MQLLTIDPYFVPMASPRTRMGELPRVAPEASEETPRAGPEEDRTPHRRRPWSGPVGVPGRGQGEVLVDPALSEGSGGGRTRMPGRTIRSSTRESISRIRFTDDIHIIAMFCRVYVDDR